MAIKRDIVVPANGGLNYDDHISVMPTGDGRYNLNCFDLRKGDHGRKRHIYGDTLISTLVLGDNESIVGGCEDVANDGNIYFIYNSVTYKTRIVRHKVNTDRVEVILSETSDESPAVLGVHTNVSLLYVDCVVIGDSLIWTDGVYDVKSIVMGDHKLFNDYITEGQSQDVAYIDSISEAGDKTLELGVTNKVFQEDDLVYLWFFDEYLHKQFGGVSIINFDVTGGYTIRDVFPDNPSLAESNCGYIIRIIDGLNVYARNIKAYTHLRPAPSTPPSLQYNADTEPSSVTGVKFYQFAYSYTYYDDTESVLSPFSKEVYFNDKDFIIGGTTLNYVDVGLLVDTYNIKSINLYVRTVDDTVSPFYLTDVVPYSTVYNNRTTRQFRGINALSVKDSVDAYKINEAIPFAAECLESVRDNALVLGGCTEGVDDVATTITSSYAIEGTNVQAASATKTETYVSTPTPKTSCILPPSTVGVYSITYSYWIIIKNPEGQLEDSWHSNTIIVAKKSSQTLTEFARFVIDKIDEATPQWCTVSLGILKWDGTSFYILNPQKDQGGGYEGVSEIKLYPVSEGISKGFSDNEEHKFEVLYYDNLNRLCGISNAHGVKVKPYTIDNYTTSLTASQWAGVAITLNISGTPPLRAKTYQVAYARPSGNKEQFVTKYAYISNGDVGVTVDDYEYTADADMAAYKAIGIDSFHRQSTKRRYQFVQGDTIRVVFRSQTKAFVGAYFETVIQSAITTSKGDTVVYIDKARWDNNVAAMFGGVSPTYVVFEVIRRSSQINNRVFLATGDVYEIGYYGLSNRYHIGDTNTGNTAHIKLIDGDIFGSSMTNASTTFYVEHEHPVFDYLFSPRAFGKAFPAQINDSIKYRNIVRNSGKLFAEAKVNRLSVFDALDYVEINSKHGKIYRLISEGNVVSVLQKANVASIYIGGREVATQEGNTEVYASDKVLGSVRDSASQYGIQHKAAVAKLDSGFAFYDNRNGVVCRKYSTGIIPITGRWSTSEGSVDYKMSKYFKELSTLNELNDALSFNHRSIRLGYEPSARLILVTTDGAEEGYQTVAFSLDSNRWTFFSDSYYRQFYTYGNKLYAVALTGLYRVLDPNASSHPTSSSEKVVCSAILNVEKPMVKIYEAITLHSPSRLKATVTTETQETQIKPIRWRKEENKYIAYIPKNWLPDRRTYLLEEGKQLQGSTATVTYESTLTEGMDILAWEVWYTPIEY